MSYCIGTLGWLSVPAFQASNGTANVSLYDQRLALEWIQEHIHRFGDDPDGVTVAPDHGVRRWKGGCTVPASLPTIPRLRPK
jgi:carboxylesterase type B